MSESMMAKHAILICVTIIIFELETCVQTITFQIKNQFCNIAFTLKPI